MALKILRNRISGISFRKRSFRKRQAKIEAINPLDLDELYLQAKSDDPAPLTRAQIFELLGEHGRHILNSLQSDCVDKVARWTGILDLIKKNFNSINVFEQEKDLLERNDFFSRLNSETEVYLEAKRLVLLWKHKLIILEMIANAQCYYFKK